MKSPSKITTLFLDIGGVLLTDGWGLDYRSAAAQAFELDPKELETRHHQAFDTYEVGKLSLDDYLKRVVFHQKRSFTRAQFKSFMFAQSKPYPQMIELVRGLKAKYGLKVLVLSNEGRELNAHRIRKFKLDGWVDGFISSCFVHLRKPDPEIFRLALDIAQVPPQHVLYVENTPMFIQVAEGLGIPSLLHTDYASTCRKLALLGLDLDRPIP
jgi:putative hydrolase of the HAD superfamily